MKIKILTAITIAILLLLILFMWNSKRHQDKPVPRSISQSEKLVSGKADTQKTWIPFAGIKRMEKKGVYRKMRTGLAAETTAMPDSAHCPPPDSSVSQTEYTVAIEESTFAVQLAIQMPHDTLPPMVIYKGRSEVLTVGKTDTLYRTTDTVRELPNPWYNSFYAGAGAVIAALAIILVIMK